MLKENLKKSEYVVVHLRGGDKPWKCEVCVGKGKTMGVLGFPNVSSLGMFVEHFRSLGLRSCL